MLRHFPATKYIIKSKPNYLINRYKNQKYIESYVLNNIKKNDIVVITLRYPYYFLKDSFLGNGPKHYLYFNDEGKLVNRSEFLNNWINLVNQFSKKLKDLDSNLIIFSPIPEFEKIILEKGTCHKQWFNKTNCELPKDIYRRFRNLS